MWLLPTLNRVDKLKKFIESAIAAETSQPGMIIVDLNDWERNKDKYFELPKIVGWNFEVTAPEAVSMGDKCRAVWDKVKDQGFVGILNDDHFVVTKEWDKKLTSRLDGKNFVSANDRWMAPQKATTATAWSMPLLETLGWPIFPPNLQHLFIDDVWELLGRSTGCWRVCMDVIVEHHHVLKGQGHEDETHVKVYSKKSWEADRQVYDGFLQKDAQESVNKIMKLQNCTPSQRYNPSPKRDA